MNNGTGKSFHRLGGEGAINIFVVCFSIVDHFYRVPAEGGGEGWGGG